MSQTCDKQEKKKMEEKSLQSVKSSSALLCWKGGESSTQAWSRRGWESREGKGVKGISTVKSRKKKKKNEKQKRAGISMEEKSGVGGGVVRSDSVKSKHRKTARERGSGRRREQHEE